MMRMCRQCTLQCSLNTQVQSGSLPLSSDAENKGVEDVVGVPSVMNNYLAVIAMFLKFKCLNWLSRPPSERLFSVFHNLWQNRRPCLVIGFRT